MCFYSESEESKREDKKYLIGDEKFAQLREEIEKKI